MSGLEPGFQLGHYRILRSLGSGGMADVYEAHDTRLDRNVALKILPIEYCRNPQLVTRFQKEVRAAAKLNHRNIVTVFEVGQQDSYHYFSMRLLTGGDLRRRIERSMSPVEALAILRELADAFAHAHARGFVHRDVKPENVMFDEQGFPVLTDFGIAKALGAETRMTRTGMTMGTPRYLAPEQASGKNVDARADLYSLGVILHEMLTGRPPYEADESMAVIFKHVTEPVPQLPPAFVHYQPLLEKLMAKDPNQRIGSAEELIRAIDALGPRMGSGEVRQSQLSTAENPLVAGLLSPSPLRTPAPTTPRPVPPPPPDTGSGEIAVVPRVTAREAAAARPATPAASVEAAYAEPQVPARRSRAAAVGVVLGVAALGAGAWVFQSLRPPAAVPAPTQPDPAVLAREEQLRQMEQKVARLEAAGLEARQKADAETEARRLADEVAAKRQQERRDQARSEPAPREDASRKATQADVIWSKCGDSSLAGAQCATGKDARGVATNLIKIPDELRTASHSHADDDEHLTVLSGRLILTTSEDRFFLGASNRPLAAGSSAVVPKGVFYYMRAQGGATVVQTRLVKPAPAAPEKSAAQPEAQVSSQREAQWRREVEAMTSPAVLKDRNAAIAESRSPTNVGMPTQFTVVNDCQFTAEVFLVASNGSLQEWGTLAPGAERQVDSSAYSLWRIFERDRRDRILREHRVTGPDARVHVCGS